MKKTVVLLLSILMLALVSCGNDSVTDDNSQTENDFEFFSDYGWGYEFSDYEEETKSEPEYDYLIDIFEDVEDWLTFSGAGDECSIDLSIPDDYSKEINGLYIKRMYNNSVQLIYNNKLMGEFSFYIDIKYNYSAGDVVTIYDSDTRELNNNLLQNGFYIKNAEYQFNYPDRGSYITSWEEAVDIFSELCFKARECYLEDKSINIDDERAKRVHWLIIQAYGEIKPDEILYSESNRVMVAATCYETDSNGNFNDYVVFMSGIVIEPKEANEDDALKDIRVEKYLVYSLGRNNSASSVREKILATATELYDEYNWNEHIFSFDSIEP